VGGFFVVLSISLNVASRFVPLNELWSNYSSKKNSRTRLEIGSLIEDITAIEGAKLSVQ